MSFEEIRTRESQLLDLFKVRRKTNFRVAITLLLFWLKGWPITDRIQEGLNGVMAFTSIGKILNLANLRLTVNIFPL